MDDVICREYLTETNDYSRFLDRLIIGSLYILALLRPRKLHANPTKTIGYGVNNLRVSRGYSENKEFILYCIVPDEREDGRMCHHVVTHVFNKPEGNLEFAFVSCFCVYNVNTAFGQKYEQEVRGPLNNKRNSLANIKVIKLSKR